MEWELELEHLGALGLAGICREISRVVRQAILPNFANVYNYLILLQLSAVLLAAAYHAHVAGLSNRAHGSIYIVAEWVSFFNFELIILTSLLRCTAAYVLYVASLYSTGADLLPVHRVLTEGPPVVPFRRLIVVAPFFVFFSALFALDIFRLQINIVLPLQLLGWASAGYAAVVGQLACVVSLLEEAALFSAVRRSRELLAVKFWAAACVLATLDGCIVVLMRALPAMMLSDALDLGLGFQLVAEWVAMFVVVMVALCAVLVVALVAQPVVYMMCKSHHQGVLDKAHQVQSTATIKVVARCCYYY